MSESTHRAAWQQATEMLFTVHKGDAGREFIDNIDRAVQAARDRGTPSRVMLTISFTPGKGQDDDVMYVSVRSEARLPKVKRGEATYFAWSDGTLRRNRELQAGMFDDDRPQLVKRVEGEVIQPGESIRRDDDFADTRSMAE